MRATSHSCGPGPVEARDGALCEALEGADAAVVGVEAEPDAACEAGADVGADAAGDDDPLVVAPGVVVPPVDAPANTIAPTARSPLMSPMASTQVSPAACCAAVGGHGYLAASVAPSPEVVQLGMVVVVAGVPLPVVHIGVPAAGGPVVPDLTVNDPVKVPVAVALRMAIFVQLIGT